MSGEMMNNAAVLEACTAGMQTCSCMVAQLAEVNASWTQCFSDMICHYSGENDNEERYFCSGYGSCEFDKYKCDCDDSHEGDDCENKYSIYKVNQGMLGSLIAFGALELLMVLYLFYWVQRYKHVPEVKAMSITFTNLTLVGIFLVSSGTIIIGSGYNEWTCVILEWCTFAGGTLILVCAAVKAYRISSIFNRRDFNSAQLGDYELFKYLGAAMSVTFILLIVFTVLNFDSGGSYRRPIEGKAEKELRCNSRTRTQVIYYLMVAYAACLLAFVLKYGNESQAAGALYKETDCIYIGSNIGTVAFIIFGIIITFTTDYTLQIAIRGFGTLITCGMLLYLLFSPKVKAVYYAETPGEDGLTDDERKIAKQYQISMGERSGKELLVVLNTIILELQQRMQHNLIRIEVSDVLLDEAKDLIAGMTDLLENPQTAHKKIKTLSTGALAIQAVVTPNTPRSRDKNLTLTNVTAAATPGTADSSP